MLLEAIVTKTDLDRLVAQFLPAELALEDGAKISLHEPFEVTLVPDRGVRVALQARVHWPVMGFHVPIDVRSLIALVDIGVGKSADGATLDLKLEIEKAEFAMLPQVIDEHIQARINEVLVQQHVAFSWNFRDTLSQVLGLPPMLQSSGTIAFEVHHGVVKVTDSALAFAVSFGTGVRARTADDDKAPRVSSPPGDRATKGAPRRDRGASGASETNGEFPLQGLVATGGAVAGIALVAAFGLGRLSKR